MWSYKRDQVSSGFFTDMFFLFIKSLLFNTCLLELNAVWSGFSCGPPVMCGSQYFSWDVSTLGGCLGSWLIKVRGDHSWGMHGCTSTEAVVREERPEVENRKWSCQAVWAISAVLSGCVALWRLRWNAFSFTGRKDVESRWQLLSRCKISKMTRTLLSKATCKWGTILTKCHNSQRCMLKDFHNNTDACSLLGMSSGWKPFKTNISTDCDGPALQTKCITAEGICLPTIIRLSVNPKNAFEDVTCCRMRGKISCVGNTMQTNHRVMY